jgi:hypothetical protein
VSIRKKVVQRFLSRPRDFTFDELRVLLAGLGCKESRSGRTSGSRVAFIREESGHIIRLHRPHPDPVLKFYQLVEIEEELRKEGLL